MGLVGFKRAARRALSWPSQAVSWVVLSMAVGLVAYSGTASAGSDPQILASIPPLAMIARDVAGGKAQVSVLNQNGSPHHRVLKPSDIRAMTSADIILWVGLPLEQYMVRFESRYTDKMLAMLEHTSDATHLYNDGHSHHDATDHHGHAHGSVDPHIWLSEQATIELALVIADRLSALNPPQSKYYQANAARFAEQVSASQNQWAQQLAPHRDAPYFVYHNAYQYLEKSLAIANQAVLTVNPGIKPTAAQLGRLAKTLDGVTKACVFYEPEFQQIRLDRVTNAQLYYQVLDPLGSQFQLSSDQPNQYIRFMNGLVDQLSGCLSQLK
ncbi:zinc ABC transporter substrate-binding protein [Litoribacillus peritrichatus]|uniref:High-affinity zinc uptake system protein ZnuA n=1 Tax=Litoribacillus peritrichatus TaxID=718191 RepID=A0ABP7NBV6_9GAMM